MVAPLFLVGAERLRGAAAGAALLLDGPEGRHAASVRRVRRGESVDVGDGAGTVARCVVTAAARDRVELAVRQVDRFDPRSPRLVLVQALAKGGRDEQAVEAATEAGADAVAPWQAARSVVRWEGERGERARRRWEVTVAAAAKQSRRPFVPDVEPALTTGRLADRVRAAIRDGGGALVLDGAGDSPLPDAALPGSGDLLVVVGPEGGVEEAETALLVTAGAVRVRLGPEIVRASTAGPLALAVLSARLGRWT